MKFNKLTDYHLEGKAVMVRLDLNVPLKDGRILDESRIQAALPTLEYLLEKKARLAIMSHLGRPKGKADPALSLAPVGERLAELLGREVVLVRDYEEEPADQVFKQLGKNQIMLLENLRFHAAETANDPDFASHLIKGFDLYVNDAFGAAHRAHASVVAAPQLLPEAKRTPGFLMEKEIAALSLVRDQAKAPFVVVIGGAKVADKIGVILNLINSCNDLLIGGAMAYTFLRYLGVEVGASRVESDKMDLVEAIYRNAKARKVTIHLPCDHIAATAFEPNAAPLSVAGESLPSGLMGLDIGPKTLAAYQALIRSAATVFWNGPLGVFEWDAFAAGSLGIAQAMAESKAYTVVGGGESVAALHKAGAGARIDHISTGGGASLEFLEGVTLPGLKALELES